MKLIDKDALVEEIERRIKSINSCPFRTAELGSEKSDGGQLNAYNVMLSFIDTLEVKEVDLEKELVNYHNENFSPCNDDTLLSCETGSELTWYDYECIAKHFFELGMAVSNKAQKGE